LLIKPLLAGRSKTLGYKTPLLVTSDEYEIKGSTCHFPEMVKATP
jgi:hypothetical protein